MLLSWMQSVASRESITVISYFVVKAYVSILYGDKQLSTLFHFSPRGPAIAQ